jgi:hypothetical protein
MQRNRADDSTFGAMMALDRPLFRKRRFQMSADRTRQRASYDSINSEA